MPSKVAGLVSIEVESGVSAFDGKGFCTIRAIGDNGNVFRGQLDPGTMRGMAMDWIESAEAAETDATLHAFGKEIGLEDNQIAHLMVALRDTRAKRKKSD